jgi:SAM-dependent methyltransferase
MSATVFVVFCMDTEGPCADPSRPDLLASWPLVDRAMDRLFDERFRTRRPDSFGGSFKIGWFFLTWTGFTTNPRGRDFGYHRIRDHYLDRWGAQLATNGDEHCWHYHHPAASGIGNEWGLDWRAPREYETIMSRQILDRAWFPSCYRAGGTIMDAQSSRWVDSWFPVDYSNRAPVQVGNLVDWSTGVADWSLYHPDVEDFRRAGAGRRLMARTLDLDTSVYRMSDAEVDLAFGRAAAGRSAVLACFDHDYRDIADRVDDYRARVEHASERFGVPWRYCGPVEAVRRYVEAPPVRALALEAVWRGSSMWIWSNQPLYQGVPWLAVETADGSALHVKEGLIRVDATRWRWDPPHDLDWVTAGIGGSTGTGESAVVHCAPGDTSPRGFLERVTTADPLHPRSIWAHSKLFPRLVQARTSGAAPEMDSVAQAVAWLSPRVRAGMRVLDAGCAGGHAARSLTPLGLDYYGIDTAARAIEIGRAMLASSGVSADRLRTLSIEDLPLDERYEVVLCLNTLMYCPDFRQPLEALARASDRWLVIRSGFAGQAQRRYLPDVLLEPGFQAMRAYFNIYPRDEVQAFLEAEGFRVEWHEDWRQQNRFGGRPEVVGGIPLPYELLCAERIRPRPTEDAILGETFTTAAARAWRERGDKGPTA